MIKKEYITERKIPVIFTILLLIVASIIYFTLGSSNLANSMTKNKITPEEIELLKNIQLKAAYTEEGTIDMFALAKSNDLAKIKTKEGNSIPEAGGIVLGNVEASMMQKEGEFKNISDNITDYDINFTIEGILTKTNTFADDFHYVNSEEYSKLDGDSNVLLIKFKDKKTPKLFYLYDIYNPAPINLEITEGNLLYFNKHIEKNKTYYPVLLGADEAKMMKDEKLFTRAGDIINDFFGKDIFIVGVLTKTNTSIDMMHIVEKDFFDSNSDNKNNNNNTDNDALVKT
jgi:hypothetical protein